MTANNPNFREELNNGPGPYRLADVNRALCLGDILGLLIDDMANTETAIDPSGGTPVNTLDLAATPTCLLDVRATAGAGATGVPLTIIVDNSDDRVPNEGEVVWDGPGQTRVRFNATDAYTAVDVKYGTDAAVVSGLERSLGQKDT